MKKLSLKGVKAKAWKAFSAYIRRKNLNHAGLGMCVTCEKWFEFKSLQAGHFIDGRNNSILFEEDGVHPQCYACNCMRHGNKVLYYKFMLKKYGQELIDKLINLSKQTKIMSEEDYKKIYERYKGYLV